jgi:hypothetical protein
MSTNKQLPENIRQAVDLISAVLRRIMSKRLDKAPHRRLYITQVKGVAT